MVGRLDSLNGGLNLPRDLGDTVPVLRRDQGRGEGGCNEAERGGAGAQGAQHQGLSFGSYCQIFSNEGLRVQL